MKLERTKPIIQVEHVAKIYRSGKVEYTAIRDVSLVVDKGEFVTVLGASGSGKTTLLDLIGTLDTPTKGKIRIDGVDVSSLDDSELSRLRNEKIGFIFQSYNLVPYLNVLENVLLPLMVNSNDSAAHIEFAKKLLAEVGLGEKMQKKPTELSGGEQQRVATIRAVVNRPLILLADEPTGNLDSTTSKEVLRILSRISKENRITIVMATHDSELVMLSDRSVHIKDGLIEKEVVVKR